MKNTRIASCCIGLVSVALLASSCAASGPAKTAAKDKPKQIGKPVVVIETSMGTIVAELWPKKAPGTVANFLQYVDSKFFDGLAFHRIVPGFVIQGGGFAPDLRLKRPGPMIQNEARSDVKNVRGTLSMARTMQVHSATSQFFINLVDNSMLDHRSKTPQGYGYCVFGRVIEGMNIVDAIAKVKTSNPAPGMQGVPVTPVVMKRAYRKK